MSEIEIQIINLQRDLSLKVGVSDNKRSELGSFGSKSCVIKGESMFLFYLSESGFSTVKILSQYYRSSLTDKHLNDYMRVLVTIYSP